MAQDAFSDEERSTGADVKGSDAPAGPVPPPNAWKKPPIANGPAETWPDQPIALPTAPASKRKGEVAAKDSGPKAQQTQQHREEMRTTEPLHKDAQSAADLKELGASAIASDSREGAPSQLAPKTPALSWRKILAGVYICSAPLHLLAGLLVIHGDSRVNCNLALRLSLLRAEKIKI